jgi:ketosteroid isomerase-like protein
MFAGIPDLRVEVHRSVQDGDTTWCEWSWTGARVDGRPFEVRGVALFRVRDGLIDAGTLYVEEVEAAEAGIERAVQGLSGQPPESP